MYIQLVGYAFDSRVQGLIKADDRDRSAEDPQGEHAVTHWVEDWMYPVAGCTPIANVIMGLWHVWVGLKGDQNYECIRTEDLTKYRIIKGLVGLAEITLVGGILVHGVATAYFYITKPTAEEARRILIERDAEQMSNVL